MSTQTAEPHENGTPTSAEMTHGDGASPSSSIDGDNVALFDEGRANGGDGVRGAGDGSRGKKNRRKKKKKRRKAAAMEDDASKTGGVTNDCVGGAIHNGDKRSHDDDDLLRSSSSLSLVRPQKKQRRRSMTSTNFRSLSSLSHSLLYLSFFALGTFVTMPLIFSTATYLSCGRADVDLMVDSVLTRKTKGGEVSIADWIRHLKRISDGRGDENHEEGKKTGKRKMGEGGADGGMEETTAESTLQESMCQVSSLAIGHFVHYLPYAQWLVLRNPLDASVADGPSPEATRETELAEEASDRKGIFRRVSSKRKHRDRDDRKHPLRRVLEGASIFLDHQKEKKMRRKEEKRLQRERRKKRNEAPAVEGGEREVDWKKWKYAMSDDYEMSTDEIKMLRRFIDRIYSRAAELSVCPDADNSECDGSEKVIASLSGGTPMPYRPLQERLDAVSWGGIDSDATRWWGKKDSRDPTKVPAHSEGGRLLAAYLTIMKWPADMRARYPFRLCAKGCDAEVSLLHTLEWREKFRPWCVSDSVAAMNRDGFIYSRGHSRPGPGQRREGRSPANEGHSMVYYRPSRGSPSTHPELYMRAMANALDTAVADSLRRNDGAVGRFNVVMDCEGMGSRHSPSVAQIKTFFSILQDHFPDRLGVLLAANLSGLARMLMKMVLPFVTEDVRAKIHIIPDDPDERKEMLSQFMEEDQVPHYLGGSDEHKFDVREYYQDTCVLEEEEILEYRTSMPYHT